jgi:hypothetical protein
MPIEEAARHAAGGNNNEDLSMPDVTIRPATMPSFMGDLLAAQHKFINAQFQFTQDADFGTLLAAQAEFIQAQSACIRTLGVFG